MITVPGVVVVVQARMSSTRLPGKVLADVGGEPLLGLLLHRLRRAERVDHVIVATSTGNDDAPIAAVAAELGARAFAGALDDVLGRYVAAIGDVDGTIVRITADCPLIDPALVDAVVAHHRATGADYTSNVDPPTFPDGLDTEAVEARALRTLAATTDDPAEREHVTLGIRARREHFRLENVRNREDLSHLRWTVDTPEDLARVRRMVSRLGTRRYSATLEDLLDVADPEPQRRA